MTSFTLRPWQYSDLAALVRNANDPEIAANMTDTFPYPYTITSGEAFLKRVIGDTPAKVMAIEIDGEVCGSIGVINKTISSGRMPSWGTGWQRDTGAKAS
jgi:RimJ/RimL family protein N-acetyltransferase